MKNNKITAIFLAVIMVSATFAFIMPAMAADLVTNPVPPEVTNVVFNYTTQRCDVDTWYNISFDLKP